jgi:hypothetical protein
MAELGKERAGVWAGRDRTAPSTRPGARDGMRRPSSRGRRLCTELLRRDYAELLHEAKRVEKYVLFGYLAIADSIHLLRLKADSVFSGWDARQLAPMGSGEDRVNRDEVAFGYSVHLVDVHVREGAKNHLHIASLGVGSVDIRRAWLTTLVVVRHQLCRLSGIMAVPCMKPLVHHSLRLLNGHDGHLRTILRTPAAPDLSRNASAAFDGVLGAWGKVWAKECKVKDIGFFVSSFLDDGKSRNEIRADFQNACPDRLPDLEKVYASLDEIDTACSLRPCRPD